MARLGLLADRISINIELPSERSLSLLAPDKSKRAILAPMKQVSQSVTQSKAELMRYRKAPQFAPAGQSTQMIIGASPETDYQILRLTEGLYQKYSLKRVFFSAYIPVAEDSLLPALDTKPPLLREHRLYQADWLLRFYQFSASEILDEQHPDFNPYLDPKCNWAVHNMHLFPVDINRCSYEMLLRVPGIRRKKRPAHSGGPAQRAAGPCRPEAYRRGAQTGPVFHHLQRLFPWRDCRAGGHRARPARPRRLWRWHGTAEPVCRARRTEAGGTGNAPCVGRAGSM